MSENRHWPVSVPLLSILTIVAIGVVGCSSKAKSRFWWCHEVGVCFATQKQCELVGTRGESSCTKKSIAYCALACSSHNDGSPYCREECAVDEVTCDDFEDVSVSVQCQPTRPVKHPELFPDHSMPGWWCGTMEGPVASGSLCEKSRERCEWKLEQLEAQNGIEVGECKQQDDVTCYQYNVDGAPEGMNDSPAYSCAASESDCQIILEANRASLVAQPSPLRILSECKPWEFKIETEGRSLSKSSSGNGPGLTLHFVVNDTNPDPVHTAKIVRSRARTLLYTENAEVTLDGGELSVFLPNFEVEFKDRAIELLTFDASWTAHHLVPNTGLMKGLASQVSSVGEILGLGIRIEKDEAGIPYLFAEDRTEWLPLAKAKELGCWREGDEIDGVVNCHRTGKQVLQPFVDSHLKTNLPPELSPASQHLFGFGQVGTGWRSYTLATEPLFSSTDLLRARSGWDHKSDRPMASVTWAVRHHAKGQSRLPNMNPLAIRRGDSQLWLVRPVLVDGALKFVFDGDYDEKEMQGKVMDLVDVLMVGVHVDVSFKDFKATGP